MNGSMKGLAAVAAAGVLALAAGCGGGDEEGASTAPATDTQPTTSTPLGVSTGEDVSGDPHAGKAIFASAGCGGCHTLAAAGSSGTTGPDLDDAQPSYELAVDRVTHGRGVMPSFEDRLSEQEIRDVATFVSEETKG